MRLTAGVEVNSKEQIIVAVVLLFWSRCSEGSGFRPQGATHSSGGLGVGGGSGLREQLIVAEV